MKIILFKKKLQYQFFLLSITILSYSSCNSITKPNEEKAQIFTYQIVNTFPHSQDAFTQGLVYYHNFLYEGTGLNGKSYLRRVELETGNILQQRDLDYKYFGEGITILGDSLYQLTWRSNIGFIYDKDSFDSLGQFSYSTEGWGLTHDDKRLIMSDGTSTIHFINPGEMKFIGEIQVRDQNEPIIHLNELEYIKGEIWANIWLTDRIARINPENGKVTAWVDLTGLLPVGTCNQPVDVLNGIAYDGENDRLFVTGKNWCKLFEIKLIAAD